MRTTPQRYVTLLLALSCAVSAGWQRLEAFPEDAVSPASDVRPGKLFYGWGRQNITPKQPVAICGQYHTRISGEVHDPLTATALAIETRDDKGETIDAAVFVSCDLVAIRQLVQEKLRRSITERLPDLDPRKVFLSGTHTHTAPALTDAAEDDHHPYDFMGMWAYRVPKTGVMRPFDYVEFLVERLAVAVVKAWTSRAPGTMNWGLGHAVVGHNRRAVYADGQARMYGRTNDPTFSHIEGTDDPSVDALFFWRPDGTLSGVTITVVCPAQEVEGELYMSADFWYDVRRLLRGRYGDGLEVLALIGAGGDQSPHFLWNKSSEKAMRERRELRSTEEIARRIVRTVEDVMETAKQDRREKIPFAHRVESVPLPVRRVTDERLAQAKAEFAETNARLDSLEGRDYIKWRVSRALIRRHEYQKEHPNYLAEIHVLRLGDFAFATNPFELFVDYGLRIKARSPAQQTSVVQLTADNAAYLPTARAVPAGGYSARIEDGIVGPAGGKVLVDETVRILGELWSEGNTKK